MPSTPLVRPGRYFRRDDVTPDRAVLVAGVAVVAAAGVFVLACLRVQGPGTPVGATAAVRGNLPVLAVLYLFDTLFRWVLLLGALALVLRWRDVDLATTVGVGCWATVPDLLRQIAGLVHATVLTAPPAPADPAAVIAAARTAPGGADPVSLVLLALATAWIWRVWSVGLARRHAVRPRAARWLAAIPLLPSVVLSLL
ncbi:MAG: hypothetical protein ABEJ42_04255 [Halobacteriaceae archaeon]